jgi:hypothetical protein
MLVSPIGDFFFNFAFVIAIVQFNVIMLVLPDSSLKSRGFWQR